MVGNNMYRAPIYRVSRKITKNNFFNKKKLTKNQIKLTPWKSLAYNFLR